MSAEGSPGSAGFPNNRLLSDSGVLTIVDFGEGVLNDSASVLRGGVDASIITGDLAVLTGESAVALDTIADELALPICLVFLKVNFFGTCVIIKMIMKETCIISN